MVCAGHAFANARHAFAKVFQTIMPRKKSNVGRPAWDAASTRKCIGVVLASSAHEQRTKSNIV